MLFLTRGGSAWRKAATAATATALAATTLAFAGSPAQAADGPIAVGEGTLSWGLSTYLGSATMGRPNPLATAYVAPASFDETTRIAAWAGADGEIGADGAATVSFAGTSVNFAKTGGAWLRLSNPAVEVDSAGNGHVTAEVAYGLAPGAFPNISYDPSQAPLRPAERIEIAELAGNTTADIEISSTKATYSDLDGTWSPEFLDFIDGDDAADPVIPGFIYAGQVNNEAVDRTLLPISFTVYSQPVVTATATVGSDYVDIAVSGTGFNPTLRTAGPEGPPLDGIYVALAPRGGLELNATDQESGVAAVTATSHVAFDTFTDGAFASSFAPPTSKIDRRVKYSIYTWTAHTNPSANDPQYSETPISIATPKQAAKAKLKVKKVPTSKANGKAAVAVTGGEFVKVTGKVKVTLKKGKATKKVNGKLNKKGKVTVKLPKLAKGKWKITVKYTGDANYKKATKKKNIKVKK